MRRLDGLNRQPFWRLRTLFMLLAVFALATVGQLSADEGEAEKDEEIAAGPKTTEVKETELLATVKTSGIFVSTITAPIIVNPEAWKALKILDVVPHGSEVMEGDPLLVFETEDLDEALEKAENDLVLATLSLRLAMDEVRFLKESTAMDLESANRQAEQASDDLKYYLEVEEAEDIKSAELNLKFARYSLEYAKEELDQLEKMYEADDLTEETEEIVLIRARRSVEMAERSVETASLRRDRQIGVLIPREKISRTDQKARTALAQAKANVSLPLLLKKKELEVEQLQKGLEEKKTKLAELKDDRASMTINAPISGYVFYGKSTHGKWTEVSAREKLLVKGGSVTPNSVVMTIVDPDSLAVLADLTEEQIATVSNGKAVLVTPKSSPTERISGVVSEIDTIAASDGKFKMDVDLKMGIQEGTSIVPGMTCSVVVKIKKKSGAIMVASDLIHQDDFSDQDMPYVWVSTDDGPEKRFVELGVLVDKKREIISGLEAGELLLQKAPE